MPTGRAINANNPNINGFQKFDPPVPPPPPDDPKNTIYKYITTYECIILKRMRGKWRQELWTAERKRQRQKIVNRCLAWTSKLKFSPNIRSIQTSKKEENQHQTGKNTWAFHFLILDCMNVWKHSCQREKERMSRMLNIGPEVKGGEKMEKKFKWNTLLLLSSHSGLQSFFTEERDRNNSFTLNYCSQTLAPKNTFIWILFTLHLLHEIIFKKIIFFIMKGHIKLTKTAKTSVKIFIFKKYIVLRLLTTLPITGITYILKIC